MDTIRDKKPRGVISLPGCVAEPVSAEEIETYGEAGGKKEPRKNRVPKGYYGLRFVKKNIGCVCCGLIVNGSFFTS